MGTLTPKIPRIYLPLLIPSRYKTCSGGRHSGKSWSFATLMICRLMERKRLAWCTREIQSTLKDSVWKLLSDTVDRLGVRNLWDITDKRFTCAQTGSEIIFSGLKDLNSDSIKSKEGVDICWCEESQGMSQRSIDILLPTVRKPGSEIWFSLNPRYTDDPIYEQFVEADVPHNIKIKANYVDVPELCSPEILQLAEMCRSTDPDKYDCLWLGKPTGMGGRVFPQFSLDVHSIQFDYSYLPQCDSYMCIDPHRKYYPAITWHAVTPSGAVVCYDEYPSPADLNGLNYDDARSTKTLDLTMEQLANKILSRDGTYQHGAKIVARTGDPRFLAENSDYTTQLMEHGVHGWRDAPFERIESQREVLKGLLHYNPSIPVVGGNTPRYYVSDKCQNVTRALLRHCYDPDRDKESEIHKDYIDSIRYFLSLFKTGDIKMHHSDNSDYIKITALSTVALKSLPAAHLRDKSRQW